MNFIKKVKDTDWVALFLSIVYAMLFAWCILGCACGELHADELKGRCIIVSTDTAKAKPVATGYTIMVKGKEYKIYRGVRGGLYYRVNGEKKYLTKKQKALIKL